MQTILGSGGVIGINLAKELRTYTSDIKLVSRNPEKVHPDDQLEAADLADADAVMQSVAGSDVAYLTVGLPYRTKIWQQKWPVIMRNVLDACHRHDCRLVFFDNIYMYDGKDLSDVTEDQKINPPSKKGKVRAGIAQMLKEDVESGRVNALIARCGDFYGPPLGQNSILAETVIKPLHQGKKANLLGSSDCRHSYTFTRDAAQATALLGNTDDAYGEVWHLPTASKPPTGKEWVELFANKLEVKPRYRTVSRMLAKWMGLVVPEMRELSEMMYQYEQDYCINSDKFERRFNFIPTSYPEGVQATVDDDLVAS